MHTVRAVLAALVGIAIAVGLTWWAVDRAGGARFLVPLQALAPWVVLPALLCEATVQISKAYKWTGLLASIKAVPLRRALAAVLIGGAATHVVPLRLDELLRARVLGRSEDIPQATVLATVAVDRVIEILVLGTLIGGITLLGTPTGALGVAMRVAFAAFCAGALVLGGFVFAEQRISAALARRTLPAGLQTLADLARDMAHGLRALPRGAALGRVVVGTAGEWTATAAMYALILLGFGHTPGIAMPATLSVGGAAAYGVPNVPGAIGTYEAAQVTLLETLMELPSDEALAIAIAAHAVLTIPVTVTGACVALSIWLRRSA